MGENQTAITSFLMDDHINDQEEEFCDEFEEFPVEDWPTPANSSGSDRVDYSLWEAEWDFDQASNTDCNRVGGSEQQLFSEQLRSEIAKLKKQT